MGLFSSLLRSIAQRALNHLTRSLRSRNGSRKNQNYSLSVFITRRDLKLSNLIIGKNLSMKTQSVSIALATFNGEKYLDEQLKSIERQSILPFEVVVYDDASTDETLNIVEKFKSRVRCETRVKKHNDNKGYRKNFIECAKECRGDIVIFCDQDDVWHQNKIHEISS